MQNATQWKSMVCAATGLQRLEAAMKGATQRRKNRRTAQQHEKTWTAMAKASTGLQFKAASSGQGIGAAKASEKEGGQRLRSKRQPAGRNVSMEARCGEGVGKNHTVCEDDNGTGSAKHPAKAARREQHSTALVARQ